MYARELYKTIWQELAADKEMIFLAGPRQAGKTTLAHMIARDFANSLYFNWDIPEERAKLLRNPSFFEEVARRDASLPLIIFDEIHKYRDWKNYLKGVYDRFRSEYRFLVSGSGRLDIYQKGWYRPWRSGHPLHWPPRPGRARCGPGPPWAGLPPG